MTNDQNVRTLTPSFHRTFCCLWWQVLPVGPLGVVCDRLNHGHWSGGWLHWLPMSLLVMLIFPPIIHLSSVPRWIQWSDTECRVQLWLEETLVLPWSQLHAYSDHRELLLLKFADRRGLRIFPGAFPPEDWMAFRVFLQRNYPVRKTSWLVRAIWGSRVA